MRLYHKFEISNGILFYLCGYKVRSGKTNFYIDVGFAHCRILYGQIFVKLFGIVTLFSISVFMII